MNKIPKMEKRLWIVFVIAILLFIFEIIGGVLANSLALIADSLHVLVDFSAIAITLFAFRMAKKQPSSKLTFGFHRAEILGALVNGILLIAVAIFIVIEAFNRFGEPPEIDTILLVSFASIGLVTNFVMVRLLKKDSKSNLNIHGSYLHVLGDLFSSIGVIIGAIIMIITNIFLVDVIVSIGIAIIISRSGIILCKKCLHVFMEGTPEEIKISELSKELMKIDEITEVHDLHVWTLTSNLFAMAVHVKIRQDYLQQTNEILRKINHIAKEKFGISHCTVQLEGDDGLINLGK